MAVLADHVAGSVTVVVTCIIVSALLEQGLQHLAITADAGHMERCAQILGLAVKECAETRKNINHVNVAFVTCDMQRRPSVRIALIQQCLGKLWILLC